MVVRGVVQTFRRFKSRNAHDSCTFLAMCGIVGYCGHRQAERVIIDGLRRLEYRGYDSAGLAVVADGNLYRAKKSGKLTHLEEELAVRTVFHLPATARSNCSPILLLFMP